MSIVNKVRSIKYLCLIMACFSFPSLQAKPDITIIKGMTELFNGIDDYSPLHGSLAWESRWIEQTYRQSRNEKSQDSRSSIQKLIGELFYLQPDDITFGPTTRSLNIGAHFTIKTIASLLGTVHALQENTPGKIPDEVLLIKNLQQAILNTLDDKAIVEKLTRTLAIYEKRLQELLQKTNLIAPREPRFEAWFNKIMSALKKIRQQQKIFDKTSSPTEEELLELGQQPSKLFTTEHTQEQFQEYFDTTYAPQYQEYLNAKNSYVLLLASPEAKQINQYKADIGEIEKYLKDLTLFKKSKSVTTICKVIAKILMEKNESSSDGHFELTALTRVLTAMLWVQSNEKQDFITYLTEFKKSAGIADNKNDDVVINDFLQTYYTKNVYFKLKTQYSEEQEIKNLLKRKTFFEELIFLYFGFNIFENSYPPAVGGSNVSIIINGKQEDFPDCGESSLRNFFNILLWNLEKRVFNKDILIRAFPHAKQELISFYAKYSDALNIEKSITYNTWAKLCSQLPGVTYGNNECNIKGVYSLINMSIVLANLLGVDVQNIERSNIPKVIFDHIKSKLKKENIILDIEPEVQDAIDDSTVYGSYEFTLRKDTLSQSFKWEFGEGHYVLEFNNQQLRNDILYKPILSAIREQPIALDRVILSIVNTLYDNDFLYEILSTIITTRAKNLYGVIVENYEKLIRKADILRLIAQDPITDGNLAALIKKYLPAVEQNFASEILRLIIKNNGPSVFTLELIKQRVLVSGSDNFKKTIIKTILEDSNFNPAFFPVVKEIFSSINHNLDHYDLVKWIIHRYADNNELCVMISETLSLILPHNTIDIVSIINTILEVKNPSEPLIAIIKQNLSVLNNDIQRQNMLMKIIDRYADNNLFQDVIKDQTRHSDRNADRLAVVGYISINIGLKSNSLALIAHDVISNSKDDDEKYKLLLLMIKPSKNHNIYLGYIIEKNLDLLQRVFIGENGKFLLVRTAIMSGSNNKDITKYLQETLPLIEEQSHITSLICLIIQYKRTGDFIDYATNKKNLTPGNAKSLIPCIIKFGMNNDILAAFVKKHIKFRYVDTIQNLEAIIKSGTNDADLVAYLEKKIATLKKESDIASIISVIIESGSDDKRLLTFIENNILSVGVEKSTLLRFTIKGKNFKPFWTKISSTDKNSTLKNNIILFIKNSLENQGDEALKTVLSEIL